MRVVQALGWYFPEAFGGTELYVAALAKRLQARGHHVSIAAPAPGTLAPRTYEHDGISVFRYPTTAEPTRAEVRGYDKVRGAEHFDRWLREAGADVVHFHTLVTGLGVLEVEAAAATSARVIATTHAASLGFICERGTMLHQGRELCDGRATPQRCAACAIQQRGVPAFVATALAQVPAAFAHAALRLPGRMSTVAGLRSLIARNAIMQRRLFDAVDAFVVLTQWAADVLVMNGAPVGKVVVNRLGVMHPGGPAPSPRSRHRGGPIVAGFIGRADPLKGLDDAIRAVTSLPPATPVALHAIVRAHTDEERGYLERCRQMAAADSRITFGTPVPPAEIPRCLEAFDLLLCPSRVVEGGPTVALEANAAGVPVVGSALPGLTEIVAPGVNGRLHAIGDWRELGGILRAVAADRAGTVDRWRARIVPPRTADDVTEDYLRLYARAAHAATPVAQVAAG
jgi:glycosyltransferase involved in cell wall biosynthesis